MKILVTGGAGFIGSQVADAYIAQGHEVVVLDNLSTGSEQNINPKARFFKGNICDMGLVKTLADEKFDVVNHHAAQVSVPLSMQNPVMDLANNGLGTLNLLEAASQAGVKRFIFISSGGAVYGEQEALPIKEDARPAPASPYAVHKYQGELYLPIYAAKGMQTVVLRYANVYGPRQVIHAEAGVVVIFTNAVLGGKQPTIYRYPDQPGGMLRDYVYVGDVVQANLAALEKGAGGVYNIGTGKPTTTLELFEALAGIAGVEPKCGFGPPRDGDLPESLVDAALAKRELGWSARVDLEEGLAKTLAWARRQAG